jgi:hypothetical protein
MQAQRHEGLTFAALGMNVQRSAGAVTSPASITKTYKSRRVVSALRLFELDR